MTHFKKCVCVSEISNLLVVTKDRAPATQKLRVFDYIHKEDIEQVHLVFDLSPMSRIS